MKKRTLTDQDKLNSKAKNRELRPSREYIHSLRGKFRGVGLMKELLAERKREREL